MKPYLKYDPSLCTTNSSVTVSVASGFTTISAVNEVICSPGAWTSFELTLAHTVHAVVGGRPVKVECNTCHAVHRYRGSAGAAASLTVATIAVISTSCRARSSGLLRSIGVI